MIDRYDFNRSLAEAARAMSEEKGTQATLDRAVQMATDMLEHCDLAGISVVHPSGIDTPAATDEALRRIDELQYEMEEGPCLSALRQTDVLVVNNLAEDPRWPNWGPHIARELDIHSSMSIRLFTSDQNLGTLNCYAMKTEAFTGDDVLDGLIVAAHAALALAGTIEEDHLRRALETRRTIGDATGILRERFGLTTDQAFGVLRRMSQTHNIKLHLVAQTLVETGACPTDTPIVSRSRCLRTREAARRPGSFGASEPDPRVRHAGEHGLRDWYPTRFRLTEGAQAGWPESIDRSSRCPCAVPADAGLSQREARVSSRFGAGRLGPRD